MLGRWKWLRVNKLFYTLTCQKQYWDEMKPKKIHPSEKIGIMPQMGMNPFLTVF